MIKTKPTIIAAAKNGDTDCAGSDANRELLLCMSNGNEFTELTNNTLNVRLQKVDTSYEYFTLQAKDKAGNMSEIYKVGNPYYENPDAVKRIQRFPERSRMQLLCQPMELQVSSPVLRQP